MTTVGTSSWGVILSSGAAADVPSGDICYFFCNEVDRKLVTKDKISHFANQQHSSVVLKEMYYTVTINNAIVTTNTMATFNSYHGLLKNWMESSTSVYVFLKDHTADYLEFDVNGTTDDWLKVRIKEIADNLTNGRKTMTISLEEGP